MKAVTFHGRGHMQVDNVPDPKILNQRDAIIKVTSTAICGSDLHLYDGYVLSVQHGDIFGHEFMGEVMEVGKEVNNLKVGDRVVVPFPIACGACNACERGLYALCENSNPNKWMAEKMYGDSPSGIFGYSHMMGGFAGGQAEYVRVPFADVGPLKVPTGMTDEQALFLSDIFPTGYMGAEMCDIQPGQTIAIWGCGPVGQFAIRSAFMLGAERVIAIDHLPERLRMAQAGGAEVLNFDDVQVLEALKEMTGGRGPDACIDAVGMEARGHGPHYMMDRAKQATRMEFDRAYALRESIMGVRNGGIVSVIGVYAGFIDKFPMGTIVNRGVTIRAGQCHVHRYMKPLLERIQNGEIDPSFVITHKMTLDQAPLGYRMFRDKQDECIKVVLKPDQYVQ